VIALAGISVARAQHSIGFDPPPGVVIQDEGTTQGRARTLNCSGADITCSVSAGVATLNATGGAGGSFTRIEVGSINTAYANFSVTDATVSPGFLRELMNPEVNALYHVMLTSRSLAQGVVETLPKESRDELSRATLTLPATDRSPKHFVYQFGLSDRVASLLLLHDERVTGSTSIELRDAVAEEPNGLYTELPCGRSSFAACAVHRRG
jgi:hypothetical protein